MPELARAGSQRWLQIAVNRKPELLHAALAPRLKLGVGDTISWRSPIAATNYREYRDMAALHQVGIRELPKRPLPAFWPPRGPVWDGLATTTGGDILLVEAKAHIPEAASPGSKASPASMRKIRTAIEETRRYLAPRSKADWTRTFYQYANRLAHLYLLRRLNRLPAHLAFVYFLNAEDMNGPATEGEWRGAIKLLHAVLGLGEEHRLAEFVHEVFIDVGNLRAG